MQQDYYPLILRHSDPHKYDHAPQGTYCKVELDSKNYKIFQQVSSDEENPRWDLIEISSSK